MPNPTLTQDEVPISHRDSTSEDSISIKPSTKKKLLDAQGIHIGIGVDDSTFMAKVQKARISQNAVELLRSYEDKDQAKRAKSILDKIESLASSYEDLELPQIDISQAEDNTIGLTWKIADATLGIGINPDPKGSSWFLLIGEENRGVTAFGNLGKLDIDLLFKWIVFLLERIQREDEGE